MKQKLRKIFAIAIFSLAVGCDSLLHDKQEFYNVKAEIESIEKASDTTVIVRINIFENGNSEGCRLKVYFDTVTVQRGPSLKFASVTSFVFDCELEKFYNVKVSPLVKGQEYFFQIFQEAYWYPGGTTSYHDSFIGSPQKFTIQ